jgi:signal transduction histidine kinase
MVLVVEDDGVGITNGDRIRLFERGFGRNTGLGLFLSREILAITDIAIEETGTEGRGARFEIRVPPGKHRIRTTEN